MTGFSTRPATRRQFLGLSAAAGLALVAGCSSERAAAPAPTGGLRLTAAPMRLDLAGHEVPTWGYGTRPGPGDPAAGR